MRPLWFEFPDVPSDLQECVLWGSNILVFPKLHAPDFVIHERDLSDRFEIQRKAYPIYPYLPGVDYNGNKVTWYDSLTRTLEPMDGLLPKKYLSLKQIQFFYRGGSIIPIKLHYNKLSLLRVQFHPIALEIYLDHNQKAEGQLYLDDGISFKYRDEGKFNVMNYRFED